MSRCGIRTIKLVMVLDSYIFNREHGTLTGLVIEVNHLPKSGDPGFESRR